jgi:hypothetical protein
VQDELTASGFATRGPDGSLLFATAAGSALQTGAQLQRAPDVAAAEPPSAGVLPAAAAPAQPTMGAGPGLTPSPADSPAAVFFREQTPTGSGQAPATAPSSVTAAASTVIVRAEAPAPAAASASVPDIDDMARKLYDRVAARLRTELTLDRERAGLLTDLR